MNLEYALQENARLQEVMGHPMGHGERAVKENMLALIVEATEVLGEVNWKPWRVDTKAIDRERVREELVDVLQFWLNAVDAMNFSAEEMALAFKLKLVKCHERVLKGQTTRPEGGDL